MSYSVSYSEDDSTWHVLTDDGTIVSTAESLLAGVVVCTKAKVCSVTHQYTQHCLRQINRDVVVAAIERLRRERADDNRTNSDWRRPR